MDITGGGKTEFRHDKQLPPELQFTTAAQPDEGRLAEEPCRA